MNIITLLVLTAVIAAAIYDVFYLKIPNFASAFIAGLAVFSHLIALQPMVIASHALSGVAVLAICFFLFAKGWLGAGDGKLLAALALFAGPGQTVSLILMTALCGGAIALVAGAMHQTGMATWIAARGVPGTGWVEPEKLPYGLAIATGTLIVFVPDLAHDIARAAGPLLGG